MISATTWQPLVPWTLALLGWWLTMWSVRRLTGDPVCGRVAQWAYGIRILLAVVLYIPGVAHWPWLQAYHGGDGFWIFADDAQAHHTYAWRMVEAWKGLGPFPQIDFDNWSFVGYIALLYQAFGFQPLNVSVLNAWFGTIGVLAGWWLLHQFGATTSIKRWGIGIVGLWPSLILWASQPLKDQLIITLILLSLAGLVTLVNQSRLSWSRFVAWLGMLTGIIFVLQLVRDYISTAFVITALIGCGIGILRGLLGGAWVTCGRLAVVAVLVVLGHMAGARMDLRAALRHRVVLPLSATAPTATTAATTRLAEAVPALRMTETVVVDQSDVPSAGLHVSDYLQELSRQVNPDHVLGLREGFVSSGGHSLVQPKADLQGPVSFILHTVRAMAMAMLGPYPWQWFETEGRTKLFRLLAMTEVLVVYLFMGMALVRGPLFSRYRRLSLCVILLFVTIVAVPMSITVVNLGTLFRLRLQFLLPLLLLACLVWAPAPRLYGPRAS